MPMRARYLSVHKLLGANKLAESSDIEICSFDNPEFRAHLTEKPQEILKIFDRASAIGERLLGTITATLPNISAEQALDESIARLTARRAIGGVYIVFDGAVDVGQPNLDHRRSIGSIDIALDAIDKKAVRSAFAVRIDRVLAGVKLGQPPEADWQTEQVGDVVLLTDGDREVYPFSIEMGGARVSLATSLTSDSIHLSKTLTQKLEQENYLDKVARLLVESSRSGADPLFAFIAGWSSLEGFVGASFKKVYCERWYSILESGVPVSALPVIRRIEAVMSDKLRLSDKFGVIASLLDPAGAERDLLNFNRIKGVRDELFHSPQSASRGYPLDEIHELLRKYLGLHLGLTR